MGAFEFPKGWRSKSKKNPRTRGSNKTVSEKMVQAPADKRVCIWVTQHREATAESSHFTKEEEGVIKELIATCLRYARTRITLIHECTERELAHEIQILVLVPDDVRRKVTKELAAEIARSVRGCRSIKNGSLGVEVQGDHTAATYP